MHMQGADTREDSCGNRMNQRVGEVMKAEREKRVKRSAFKVVEHI